MAARSGWASSTISTSAAASSVPALGVCYSALLWTVAHADELQIDPSRVSIGGGSAGGDLAAVVAMMARDRDGPPLVLQVLDIPVTDLTMSCPSVVENGEGYLLTREAIEQYVDLYLEDPSDAKNPYASPLLAEDLSGLPPAIVMTAEFDPLRDEGEAYAARLAAAGVPVTHRRWLGHVHGSSGMTGLLTSACEWRSEVIDAMRAAYQK
jgi:acetyl esterase